MVENCPIFTIDLEDWNDALHIEENTHTSLYVMDRLLEILHDYKVRAVIYKLEYIDFYSRDHVIRSHGRYHRWWEIADRRPYQWLGFTGGFWFRVLPFWFIKWQVKKQGVFYIHPHDLDLNHPKLSNPILNWKRHVGLKGAWKKLERLLQEVKFGDPGSGLCS